MFNTYVRLCSKYHVLPTLEVFSFLVGINRTTFTDWMNGVYRTNSSHGDTAKNGLIFVKTAQSIDYIIRPEQMRIWYLLQKPPMEWQKLHQYKPRSNTEYHSRQPSRSRRSTKRRWSFQRWKNRSYNSKNTICCDCEETDSISSNTQCANRVHPKKTFHKTLFFVQYYNGFCIAFPWLLPKAYDKQRPGKGSGSHGAEGWLASVRTGWPGGGIYKTPVSGSYHQNRPKKQKSSP